LISVFQHPAKGKAVCRTAIPHFRSSIIPSL